MYKSPLPATVPYAHGQARAGVQPVYLDRLQMGIMQTPGERIFNVRHGHLYVSLRRLRPTLSVPVLIRSSP
jgi:hypothetical protein